MKNNLLCFFLCTVAITGTLQAQETGTDLTAQRALEKVLKVLRGSATFTPSGKSEEHLCNGAWEALAYSEEQNDSLQASDISQAVPDYYHFYENKTLLLKLIDPDDYNQYGQELRLQYAMEEGYIVIQDKKTGAEKDRWEILYLDKLYMALDLGELRVFFTHTPVQE